MHSGYLLTLAKRGGEGILIHCLQRKSCSLDRVRPSGADAMEWVLCLALTTQEATSFYFSSSKSTLMKRRLGEKGACLTCPLNSDFQAKKSFYLMTVLVNMGFLLGDVVPTYILG